MSGDLVERLRACLLETAGGVTYDMTGDNSLYNLLRTAADRIEALEAERNHWSDKALMFENDYAAQAARIKSLEAELKEERRAVWELQSEACARDGAPMPSQRPLVDTQAARITALEAALRSLGFWQLSRDNENVGWHGVPSNRDQYACEFCRQEHEDFMLLEHKPDCPITVIRALEATDDRA